MATIKIRAIIPIIIAAIVPPNPKNSFCSLGLILDYMLTDLELAAELGSPKGIFRVISRKANNALGGLQT